MVRRTRSVRHLHRMARTGMRSIPQSSIISSFTYSTTSSRHTPSRTRLQLGVASCLPRSAVLRVTWRIWSLAVIGVWPTAPYGHDGRSMTLDDVILRHGGESQKSRDAYAALPKWQSDALQAFLNSLVLF